MVLSKPSGSGFARPHIGTRPGQFNDSSIPIRSPWLTERRDHLLAEQADRVARHRQGHAADLVVAAEDVVADQLLPLLELADHGLRAADDGEPLLDVEVV